MSEQNGGKAVRIGRKNWAEAVLLIGSGSLELITSSSSKNFKSDIFKFKKKYVIQ